MNVVLAELLPASHMTVVILIMVMSRGSDGVMILMMNKNKYSYGRAKGSTGKVRYRLTATSEKLSIQNVHE